MSKLDLEFVSMIDESKLELMEKDIRVLEGVTVDTDFDDLDLYSSEEWKAVRYYLRDIKRYHTIDDLGSNIDEIMNDIRNLKLLDEVQLRAFLIRLHTVYKCYGLR